MLKTRIKYIKHQRSIEKISYDKVRFTKYKNQKHLLGYIRNKLRILHADCAFLVA